MGATLNNWLYHVPSNRARRGLRGIFTNFLNDDTNMTFKDIVFGAGTTPITLSSAFTTGISMTGAGTTAYQSQAH